MERVRTNRVRIKQGNILTRHIVEHKSIYIILFLLFVIGFIIGGVNAAFVGEEIKTESQNYILEFVESLKTQEIDSNILLKESMRANIKPIVYIMLFGLVIIGIPFIFIYIGVYSYSIGFTVTSILLSLGTSKGLSFIFTLMIPQEIVLIPTIMIISVNAILFSKITLNLRNINLKTELIKYTGIFIIGLLVSMGISLFETYVGSNLIKFAVRMM
ncbi:MAG: stage II sporulation protein M [Clostridiales bacterium]|nr:stage II sporulation protein M [Clostridiales bacterium]